jgi:chromosome segregation ATPase
MLYLTMPQATLAEQGRIATDRIAEVERVRAAALQEAAFCRAKLAAYETGHPDKVVRLDNDRTSELENQVSRSLAERTTLEKKISELNESLATENRLREEAEARIFDLNQRALQAEGALERTAAEHGELLEHHATTAAELRSTAEKLVALTSSQQLRDVDTGSSAELMELRMTRDRHVRALEQTQLALKAASARADEAEEQWRRANEQFQHLQAEYADLNRELEAKITEVDNARAQLLDVENKFAKSREEADALRALTTGSLGELLDYHRDMQADEERTGRAQNEKVRLLQNESESLREMLRVSNQRQEDAQNELNRERKRARAFESEQVALRAQVSGIRAQLSTALADVARARKEIADKETELRESSKAAMDVELRFKMFRNYLSESGVVVDEEEMASNTNEGSKLYELEAKLAERNREQEALNRQLRHAQEQSQMAEEKVASLSTELARAKERRSADGNDDSRVAEVERKLASAEATSKQKLLALEEDYRTAVLCVKGTEKMLKKMKDELAKQKGLNASLQSELEGVRSGSEGGSRVRPPNGRVTPLSDDGQESALRTQLIEAQRQTQRLTAENQDLHRRLELLQGDLDRLKRELENLQHEANSRLSRIEMLEDENERLESSLAMSRPGGQNAHVEQMQREITKLRRENEQLSQRIELLLDVEQHPGSHSPNLRASDSSMDPNINMDSISNQLDDWQRRYANDTNAVSSNDYSRDHR